MPPDWLLLLLAVMTLTARIGAALYLCGLSRAKNAAGAILRSIADLCLAVLVFWAVGDAIMEGRAAALFGLDGSFGAGPLFLCASILIATAAALGGSLERTRLVVPLAGTILLAAGVIPLAARWAWTGWLHNLGFMDIAGASFLHVTGGLFAGVAAIFARPRAGKYNRDGSANLIPGHSFPLSGAGALILLIALIPQLAGCCVLRDSSATLAATGALLAAAAGSLAALILGRIRYATTDIHLTVIGLLAGVISTSAAAGRLSLPLAVLIGALGGLFAAQASIWIDLRRKIDDPGSALAIHFVAGAVALLAAPLAIPSPLGFLHQLLIQFTGLVAIGALTVAAAAVTLLALHATLGLRPPEVDELDGIDLVEHDINAYPDFQQTMIKSYHLRET